MEVKLTKKQRIEVSGSKDIFLIMRQILRRENKVGRSREHFWVIGLNNASRILYIELMSLGSFNEATVNPGDVFQLAIHKLAVKVVLVHNHPSGNVKPSDEDKDLTDHMIQAGKFLSRVVVDHLIISENSYYSSIDSGLFAVLKKSKKWVLRYKEEARHRKEGKTEGIMEGEIQGVKKGIKKGIKEGEKKRALQIAKKMLAKGMKVGDVVSFTGLTKAEVNKMVRKKR